jgi:hypothetical protein
MAKPEKIMKKCKLCGGRGALPPELAKLLPKPPAPGKTIKCPRCKGKGFEFAKPKN